MRLYDKQIFLFLFSIFMAQNIQAADAVSTVTAKNYGSVEERRLDTTILQERTSMRGEREDIAMRKKELKTLEEGVDKKLTEMDVKLEELRKLQKKIESLLADKSLQEKKRIQNLANIYQKMSPDRAALALSGLDQQLAADLLANMKVKAAAKILDQTPKITTTELSTTFTSIQIE